MVSNSSISSASGIAIIPSGIIIYADLTLNVKSAQVSCVFKRFPIVLIYYAIKKMSFRS